MSSTLENGIKHIYLEHIFDCEKWSINDFINVNRIKKTNNSFNAIALEENFFTLYV